MSWLKELPGEKNTQFFLKAGEYTLDSLVKKIRYELRAARINTPHVFTKPVIEAETDNLIEVLFVEVRNDKAAEVREIMRPYSTRYEKKG